MGKVKLIVPGPGNLAIGSALYAPGTEVEVDDEVAAEVLPKAKPKPKPKRRAARGKPDDS